MGEFWIVKFLETEFLDPLPLAILLAREETKPLMGAVFICMVNLVARARDPL